MYCRNFTMSTVDVKPVMWKIINFSPLITNSYTKNYVSNPH